MARLSFQSSDVTPVLNHATSSDAAGSSIYLGIRGS